jgi:superfamily II DNA or RNA helicase
MGKLDDTFQKLAEQRRFDLLEQPIATFASRVPAELGAILRSQANKLGTVGGLWGDNAPEVRAALAKRKEMRQLQAHLDVAAAADTPLVVEPLPTFSSNAAAESWLVEQGCVTLVVEPMPGLYGATVRHALVKREIRHLPEELLAWAQTRVAQVRAAASRHRDRVADLQRRDLPEEIVRALAVVAQATAATDGLPPGHRLTAPPYTPTQEPHTFIVPVAGISPHAVWVRLDQLGTPRAWEVDALLWAIEAAIGTFGPRWTLRPGLPAWEQALLRLPPPRPVTGPAPPAPAPAASTGPVYLMIDVRRPHHLVQAINERGEAYPSAGVPALSLEDRALIILSRQITSYDLREIAHLAGHPRLRNREGQPLDLQVAAPSLHLVAHGDSFRLVLGAGNLPLPQAALPNGPAATLHEASTTELRLVVYRTDVVFALHDLKLLYPLAFPRAAFPVVFERLESYRELLPVYVDPALVQDARPGEVEPVLHLVRSGKGIEATLLVLPGPGADPVRPGEGAPHLYVPPHMVYRDLARERDRAIYAAAALGWERLQTHVVERTDELANLLRAAAQAEPPLRVAWEGRPRKVLRRVTARDLRVRMTRMEDMLKLGGNADIDGVLVELAALVRAAAAGERFVVVQDGIAEIGDDLATHLRTLARVGGEDPALPALATGPIESLVQAGVELEAPPEWSARLAASRAAATLPIAEPDGLRATLRPYQREGFTWMARMASWSPGALLCDDMGLGKTVQALALLLSRKDLGPALVVAPTSVVFNWAREAEKFAPGLQIIVHQGSRRKVAAPAPGQLWVTSWDLLVRDKAQLSDLPFATLVFDEAQAAKNPDSQRAKAARAMNGAFNLVITGTPLENRMADLWSLASFGVPGLFGSWEQFRTRFAGPIERDRDEEARATLKKLLGAFLLRRTKLQVAPELPPRTEVIERLPLSPPERAAYDKARIAALAQLKALLPPQQRRFQVLASLTRLRQIACDAGLVGELVGVPAKTARLVERCQELVSEGSSALVFSAFARLLERVEPALREAGLRTLRLDGTTPAADRRRLVDQFQNAEADVFLISLKAGGSGLNLTNADTVFHLDPWWNPAAEAQATDRAHRIGQTRPVTVYKLVAEGTVEEGVLAMQAEKQAMVASVLDDDGGAAGPIDVDDLTALLEFTA